MTPDPRLDELRQVLSDIDALSADRDSALTFMPFFVTEFLWAVRHWNKEQVACYVLLLLHEWIDQGLPGDIEDIGELLNVKPDKMRRLWSGRLGQKFVYDPDLDRHYNLRNEKVRRDVIGRKKRRPESAGRSGNDGLTRAQRAEAEALANRTETAVDETPF